MRLNAVSHIGFSYQGTQLIRGFNMTNLIEHNFLFRSAGNTPNIDLIKIEQHVLIGITRH